MPSRNSAAFSILFDSDAKPFHLYLTGSGAPWVIKQLMRSAFRARRAATMADPELFVVWFFRYCVAKTRVNITRRELRYVWQYRIDMLAKIPTIRIASPSGAATHPLFKWLGPERIIEDKIEKLKPNAAVQSSKRGRPSSLSKLGYSPIPEWFLKGKVNEEA